VNSLGVYASTAVTAVTAQNTQGVQAIHTVPCEIVAAQIASVLSDIGADVIKIGMLATHDIIHTIADTLDHLCFKGQIVLDPVMVATSGDRLLDDAALDALKTRLIPMATLITPNIPEAIALLGTSITDVNNLAAALEKMYATAVLVKGGHGARGDNRIRDILYEGGKALEMASDYIETRNTHGTGCTLASAIAAYLARGESLSQACQKAHHLVHQAILDAPNLGEGHGPLGHHKIIRPE